MKHVPLYSFTVQGGGNRCVSITGRWAGMEPAASLQAPHIPNNPGAIGERLPRCSPPPLIVVLLAVPPK
jgi:hypothetical protein